MLICFSCSNWLTFRIIWYNFLYYLRRLFFLLLLNAYTFDKRFMNYPQNTAAIPPEARYKWPKVCVSVWFCFHCFELLSMCSNSFALRYKILMTNPTEYLKFNFWILKFMKGNKILWKFIISKTIKLWNLLK